ncbi:MAG: HDOD domain-containing protein [Planctomycetes bacterium]|nr:HDOD domain-containing protein [Planctomycetota bacterium]
MLSVDDLIPSLPSTPEIPEAVLDRLRLRANHLKMLPAVAAQALEIVKDPDCSINEFSAVVERDATLATEILRLANSVLFSGSRTVVNLHQAVIRLGLRQCKNLILSASFSSMMKKMTLAEESIRHALWRHSFLTALLAMEVNQSLDAGFHGEEFTGGLIHDIGRMLICVCFPEEFLTIDPMTFDGEHEALQRETNHLGTTHCEVGAWFVQKNALPDMLSDAVRFHHKPQQSEGHRRFVALIATCDHMANHLQWDVPATEYDLRQNPGILLLEDCGVVRAGSRLQEIAPKIMPVANHNAAEMLNF